MSATEICVGRWEKEQNRKTFDTEGIGTPSSRRRRVTNLKIRHYKEEAELMDKFLIRGGKALRGTVAISGAKNSALPVMAACLLTAEKVRLYNIPKVRDLVTMGKLLTFMHAKVAVT